MSPEKIKGDINFMIAKRNFLTIPVSFLSPPEPDEGQRKCLLFRFLLHKEFCVVLPFVWMYIFLKSISSTVLRISYPCPLSGLSNNSPQFLYLVLETQRHIFLFFIFLLAWPDTDCNSLLPHFTSLYGSVIFNIL